MLRDDIDVRPSHVARACPQMRKLCNHPDLIIGPYTKALTYPVPGVLIEQCGKFALLDRLLTKLRAGGHKVRRIF